MKLEKKSLTRVFTNVGTKKPSMHKHEVQLGLFSQIQNLKYNKHKMKTKKLDKRKTKKFMNIIYKQESFKERCNVHLESNNYVDL